MIYKCPACRKPAAKVDRRRTDRRPVGMNGASVHLNPGVAPRVRCSCGHLLILMKGKL